MKHLSTLALPVLATAMLSGCGTILTPSQALVTFTSDPPGADVLVDGMPVGRTPVQTFVSNRRDHVVTLQDERGESTTCVLYSSLGAGWLVLDILLGLVPVIVDAATSGWNELEQHGCHATFRGGHYDEDAPTPVSSAE